MLAPAADMTGFMTEQPDRSRILAALEAVADPKSGRGLVSAGLVQALVIGPGRAGFMIEVEVGEGDIYAPVRDAAELAMKSVPGVDKAQVGCGCGGAPSPYPPHPTRRTKSRHKTLNPRPREGLPMCATFWRWPAARAA
jgi:ATP-binding protein involved in chromosome partitioning